MEVMNLDLFLEEMDNDYDIVGAVIAQYIKSLSDQLKAMPKLLKDKLYTDLSREAHSIKGGARNLMAPRLEVASKELEDSAVRKEDSDIDLSIKKLTEEFNIYKDFVADNLSSLNLEC